MSVRTTGSRLPVPADELVLFRTWTLLFGGFYSLWSVLVWLLLEGMYDAPVERVLVTALFFAVAGWSWHPTFDRRRLEPLVAALSVGTLLHFLSLVHRSGDHVYYLFAVLVVLGVISVGFRSTRYFIAFSVFAQVTQVIYAVGKGLELQLAVCFVGFATTSLAASGCLLYLRERSERQTTQLLHNILPSAVVERLQLHRGQYTERSEAVTVLFADIVGFTQLTRSMNADRLIDHLDELFSQFDAATEQFGIEKIKTIGDCYMAVCGAPVPNPEHQTCMLQFGQRMLEILQAYRQASELDLQLRVGVHTGPIVAGVIGSKKTVYDLWGDTVNLASRMESHGRPGRIHVSAVASEGVTDVDFTALHVVEVKGIGPVEACFVARGEG